MASDIELEQLERFNELLKEANTRWGGLNSSIAAMDAITKTGMRDRKEENTVYKRMLAERKREEADILKAQRAGKMTQRETNTALKQLNDRISDTLPDELKTKFQNLVKAESSLTQSNIKFNDALAKANPYLTVMGTGAKLAGTALKGLIEGYQRGGTDMQSATAFTSLAFNLAADGSRAVGEAASGVGGALVAFGGNLPVVGKYVKGLGIGLSLLGPVLNLFGKGLSEVARSVLPVLNAELEKSFNAFIQLNNSGAMFANGMSGMIAAATRSNLTLDEFSDVVKSNSETLAKSGMGVTAAAQRMSDVSVALRRGGLDKQLYNLGYTYKDQAELVAETMALMRQSGGRLMASDDVVAAQTQKYAENLRIIAAITGEDAKTKMKEAQQASNELAFQQKLAGMDETTRAGTIEAMASMSDLQRKAFMEQVVFGTQITQETAYATSNIAGMGDSVNAYVAAFNNGTISAQKSLEIQSQYGETIKKSILSQTDLAAAGMAGVSDIATALKTSMQGEVGFRNKFTEEATAAAQANLTAQKTGTDRLQNDMISAAEAARALKMAIQNELLGEDGAIHGYAKIVKIANEEMLEAIRRLKEEIGVDSKGKATGKVVGAVTGGIGGAAAGGMVGAGAGAILGAIFPPSEVIAPYIGYAIGSAIGGYFGEEAGNDVGGGIGDQIGKWWNSLGGNADGGLLSGPVTGYLTKLHGTEAVLPPDLTAMLTEVAQNKQSESERMATLQTLIGRDDQMQRVATGSDDLMNMLIGKVDELIYATKNVANYAELTAQRIA
jgi:hypothetical protein